jgi:hypothetical protein
LYVRVLSSTTSSAVDDHTSYAPNAESCVCGWNRRVGTKDQPHTRGCYIRNHGFILVCRSLKVGYVTRHHHPVCIALVVLPLRPPHSTSNDLGQ